MQKPNKEAIWQGVMDSLKVSVSTGVYTTWLSQTQLTSLKKVDAKRYSAEIGCGSAYVKSTVESRYFGMIQDALMKVIDSPVNLTFTVDNVVPTQLNIRNKRLKAESQKITQQEETSLFDNEDKHQEFLTKITIAKVRLGFTFDNFAVSGSNQMAYAAAEAVSRSPGSAYNPLFIYGGVGVGKTHLMHAIGYVLLKDNLNRKVLACTGEEFTNDIVEGIRRKTTQNVRDKYRRLDAIFVDDIQFIAGKDTVQEEFFHTFNAVTSVGGQIVLTSDKPPSEIQKLEERLKSRFEAGLIVDIAPPDFELRCAIVQIKSELQGIELPTECVHLIAGNLDKAREIEGVLIRIASEVKFRNVEPTEELVTHILGKGKLENDNHKEYTPEKFIDAVCGHYNISKRAMMGAARAKMIAEPRQILMYLLRTEMQLPYQEVGRLVGGRDHTTVMHAVNKVTAMSSSDVNIREDIMLIKKNI